MPPTLYIAAWGRYGRNNWEWSDDEQAYVPTPMPQSERTRLDLILEMAYLFYKDAACSTCGTPWWYGRSTDSRVNFELETSVCYACQKIEMERDQRANKKNPPKRFGVTDIAVPTGIHYEETGYTVELPSPFEAAKKV